MYKLHVNVLLLFLRGKYIIIWSRIHTFSLMLIKLATLRLRLNRLQTDSRNDFPEKGMFGCYWKFGQTENDFSLTVK